MHDATSRTDATSPKDATSRHDATPLADDTARSDATSRADATFRADATTRQDATSRQDARFHNRNIVASTLRGRGTNNSPVPKLNRFCLDPKGVEANTIRLWNGRPPVPKSDCVCRMPRNHGVEATTCRRWNQRCCCLNPKGWRRTQFDVGVGGPRF